MWARSRILVIVMAAALAVIGLLSAVTPTPHVLRAIAPSEAEPESRTLQGGISYSSSDRPQESTLGGGLAGAPPSVPPTAASSLQASSDPPQVSAEGDVGKPQEAQGEIQSLGVNRGQGEHDTVDLEASRPGGGGVAAPDGMDGQMPDAGAAPQAGAGTGVGVGVAGAEGAAVGGGAPGGGSGGAQALGSDGGDPLADDAPPAGAESQRSDPEDSRPGAGAAPGAEVAAGASGVAGQMPSTGAAPQFGQGAGAAGAGVTGTAGAAPLGGGALGASTGGSPVLGPGGSAPPTDAAPPPSAGSLGPDAGGSRPDAGGAAGASGAGGQAPNAQKKSMTLEEIRAFDVIIIGAGLSGAVLSDMYARYQGKRVLVMDYRDHIGGNCYDFTDPETGILMSKYGAHLFHTNKKHVWQYVHRFSEFLPYEHRVIARVDEKLVPIPVNINTMQQLTTHPIKSVETFRQWLTSVRTSDIEPTGPDVNSEQVGIYRVGKDLYEKIFKEYTMKQWDKTPAQLAGTVLSRIPINENWDDRYFPNDEFQGLPEGGYTKMFEKIYNHPNIVVKLQMDYYDLEPVIKRAQAEGAARTLYFTGPIDQFFQRRGAQLPPLQYRSIRFERKTLKDYGVVQPQAVVNNPELRNGLSTRSVEYKHFYYQKSDYSVVVSEYSTDIGEPYYPIPSDDNKALYEKYRALAAKVEEDEGVHFVGRLAQYKYFDMDDAIDNALELYQKVEGPDHFQRMMQGAAVPLNPLTKGMMVHFVVALHSENLSWIQEVCKDPFFGTVRTKWFVYVKRKDRGLKDVETEIFAAGSTGHCRLDAGSVDVRRLDNVGREAHTYLKHIFGSQFMFGDANVFVQGDKHAPTQTIVCALKNIKNNLFPVGKTRASQPENTQMDLSFKESAQTNRHYATATQCQDSAFPPSDANLLHFIPLAEPQSLWKYSKEIQGSIHLPAYWRYFTKLHTMPFLTFAHSEFICTEAALRRMLQKYRTTLWDVALDQDLSFADLTLAGKVFGDLWYSLFNEIQAEEPTVGTLSDDSRLGQMALMQTDKITPYLAPQFSLSPRAGEPNTRRGSVFDTHAPIQPNPFAAFSDKIQSLSYAVMSRGPSLAATRLPSPPATSPSRLSPISVTGASQALGHAAGNSGGPTFSTTRSGAPQAAFGQAGAQGVGMGQPANGGAVGVAPGAHNAALQGPGLPANNRGNSVFGAQGAAGVGGADARMLGAAPQFAQFGAVGGGVGVPGAAGAAAGPVGGGVGGSQGVGSFGSGVGGGAGATGGGVMPSMGIAPQLGQGVGATGGNVQMLSAGAAPQLGQGVGATGGRVMQMPNMGVAPHVAQGVGATGGRVMQMPNMGVAPHVAQGVGATGGGAQMPGTGAAPQLGQGTLVGGAGVAGAGGAAPSAFPPQVPQDGASGGSQVGQGMMAGGAVFG